MKTYKCGINPESNVHLVFRGGCEKLLTPEDAYRCTGCNQRFHKDCIIEHFKLEKEHDWGRKDERQAVIKEVEGWLVDEKRETIKVPHSSYKKGYCIKTKDNGVYTRNKLRAELRAKLVEMKEGK